MSGDLADKIASGGRITPAQAIKLFKSDDIFTLGGLASLAAKRKNGNKVYYIRNVHVNPTNICVNRCRFCAFSRSKGEPGAYELTIRQIISKLKKLRFFDEVHIVGGLHPDWAFGHYLDMLSEIKRNFPKTGIKAFTAVEVDYMRKKSGLPLKEVFERLKASGLDVMPGGGAEIFDPAVRNALCPEKMSGRDWLKVMRTAHDAGIRTNATMLYGHIENYRHRVAHLERLRRLQDETGGFQAFIPLPYQPQTEIGGRASSGIEDLKCIAISRIFLDNFDHVKAYWVMLGEKLSQVALRFGADDLEGTVIEEKIAHSAGARTRPGLAEEELRQMIVKAGKKPVRRGSLYGRLA
ncbi:MAG: aminofutalosine synthase MqnE [Nitrospiraceae bacterium]|nr:aminofutalosine synthase MqnE [Nitrospiraceae bacterium]